MQAMRMSFDDGNKQFQSHLCGRQFFEPQRRLRLHGLSSRLQWRKMWNVNFFRVFGVVQCSHKTLHGDFRCSDGYFGNPLVPGNFCQPCVCSGNVDLAAVGNCERLTGKCLKCVGNTEGFTCERCRKGYHGNALKHDCQGYFWIFSSKVIDWLIDLAEIWTGIPLECVVEFQCVNPSGFTVHGFLCVEILHPHRKSFQVFIWVTKVISLFWTW